MEQNMNGNDKIKITAAVGDFVLLNVLLILCLYVVPGQVEGIVPPYLIANQGLTFLTANFALIISEQFFHPIVHRRLLHFMNIAMQVFKLALLQAILMFSFIRVVNGPGGLFKFMFIFGAAFLVLLLLGRLVEWLYVHNLRRRGRNTRTVLLVGNDPALVELYEQLTDVEAGFIVKGYYADVEMKDCPERLRYLGTIAELNQQIAKSAEEQTLTRVVSTIDDLFCCLSHDRSEEIINIMRFCDNSLVHFYYLPRHFGAYRLNMKPEMFGNIQIFTNHNEPLSRIGNQVVKRTFDILFSLVVCILLLPLIPIIALCIELQSRGPIFFRQERTGINGKTFTCLKFRSMHVNKDADTVQATKNDPRKFAFGEFMRKTNIDELPQFFNVLKGDMSVVGPRPHMLHHTEIYGKLIDKYMVRHFCRPGITGWAQVTGSRGETKELWQMEERIKKDIWYIENWSFWLDIRIIFMTVGSVFHPDKQAY